MTKPRSEDELRAVVRGLASDLHSKVAFVCEVCDERHTRARTLALYVDDDFLDDIEYDLAGTPCAGVYEKGVQVHAADVAKLYPSDQILQDWSIESYIGVPFYDPEGQLIGHVGVLHDRPREDFAHSRPALERAAEKVRAEIIRRRQSR